MRLRASPMLRLDNSLSGAFRMFSDHVSSSGNRNNNTWKLLSLFCFRLVDETNNSLHR